MVGFIKELTLSIAGMIDCAIVGRYLGETGLSAMKLAMPVFSILSLFSIIMSTGLSVAVSRALTKGDREGANCSVQTAFTVVVIVALVCMTIGVVRPSLVTRMLAGKNLDRVIFDAATDYLAPILFAAIPFMLFDVLGTLAVLEGKEKYMKIASVVILVANVTGDLVVVWLGWGIFGIAMASGFAYLCAFLVIVFSFFTGRSMLKIRFRKPNMGALGETVLFGSPMVIRGLCGILWPLSVNRIMLHYGTMTGLAALSIQDAVHYLPAALCSGIASAALILTGICAGERDDEGLRQVNRYILQWSLIGGFTMMIVLGALAYPIMRLFSQDPLLLDHSVSALRLYLIGIPFLALNFSSASYLQGLGRKQAASVLIFVNHILLSILSAFVLARLFGTTGVFASYGICEIIMSLILLFTYVFFSQRRAREERRTRDEHRPEIRETVQSINDAVAVSLRVNDFCLANGIDARAAHHIALCTEELATNSIEHGFKDSKKHHVALRAVIDEGMLYLRLRDDCRRFDLVERYKMINPDDPTKNIGLRIVFAKADEVNYSSTLNMNNVCVKYKI